MCGTKSDDGLYMVCVVLVELGCKGPFSRKGITELDWVNLVGEDALLGMALIDWGNFEFSTPL